MADTVVAAGIGGLQLFHLFIYAIYVRNDAVTISALLQVFQEKYVSPQDIQQILDEYMGGHGSEDGGLYGIWCGARDINRRQPQVLERILREFLGLHERFWRWTPSIPYVHDRDDPRDLLPLPV